jgi:hypothetical protein
MLAVLLNAANSHGHFASQASPPANFVSKPQSPDTMRRQEHHSLRTASMFELTLNERKEKKKKRTVEPVIDG